MQLARVVVNWSGPSVKGLAVNVLHFAGDGSPPDPAAIKNAYAAIGSILPGDVRVTIPNSGEVIEDTTGTLLSVWTGAGGGTVTGGLTQTAAAGVGACASWKTGGIVNGRTLRGRTFIAPLATSSYETDGTLSPTAVTGMNAFITGMLASGPLAVWHRPTTPGGSDGNSYGVIAGSVRDRAAFLSSRRD